MAVNECGDETGYNAKELRSIYGPYRQTLFLGCSVLSFSASAGWNGQNSEVTVELARDECESPEGHYKELWTDQYGNAIYTELTDVALRTTSNPDPGFTYPNIGAPVYFRVADFEYSGILQGWTVKEGADGNPVYSVKIVDPRVVLDNTQVILDNYEGPAYDPVTNSNVFNLLNVYGYLEWVNGRGGYRDSNGVTTPCVDWVQQHGNPLSDRILNVNAVEGGTGFGAPAGGFGGSRKTDRGISWNYIRSALQDLAGSMIGTPDVRFSQGGIFFRPGSGRGYGELNTNGGRFNANPHGGTAKYIIDLEEVPTAQWDYRITGPVTSLSEIINQVCADAGCDYYVELLPTDNNLVIKVRTISRFNQPSLGVSTGEITEFISKYNIITGTPGYGIVNDSFGRELRTDVNTSFIIGAKARQYYEAQSAGYMTPFWGYDAEGRLLMSHHNGERVGWKVRLDFRKLNLALHTPISLGLEHNTFGWVYENELRYALGDEQAFRNALMSPNYGIETPLRRYLIETLNLSLVDPTHRGVDAKAEGGAALGGVRVGLQTGKNNMGAPGNTAGIDVKTLFNWLSSYAGDVYGKQFLFQVPYLCTSVDEDSKQRIFSDEPSTEGGWASLLSATGGLTENPNVLGIVNPSMAADFFKDDVGKFQPMVQFTGTGLNTASLSPDDYITTTTGTIDYVWSKASIEPEWVYGTPYSGLDDTDIWSALVKINSPVKQGDLQSLAESRAAIFDPRPRGVLTTGTSFVHMNSGLATQTLQVGGLSNPAAFPMAGGIPVKSNTRTYGPWINVGANPGSVQCEMDDGLAPWEYGGIAYMNMAGLAKVLNASTNMQVGERGEVTIPGYPIISLGSALKADPPNGLFEGRGVVGATHQWANRVVPYHYVSWNAPPFNRAAPGQGASVSNINVTVGAGGVTTSYTISTFTPVFGRFAKSNADRIKQIGLNKLQAERERRAQSALKRLLKGAQDRATVNNVSDSIGKSAADEKSSILLFAGKLLEDPKRKIVVAPDHESLVYYEDYENTSMMSMDGLMRPISNYGDASLPKIATNSGTCSTQPTQTDSPPPPIAGYTGLSIRQKYLDFLADPVSNTTLLDDARSSGSTSGHDIESVARKSMTWLEDNQPGGTDSMLMHVSGTTGSYADDYRYLAMRGPMVMQGWGYDIHGKPIPNAVGDGGGSFQNSYDGLKDQFKQNWLSDATEWPAAPIDLRFDRKRGVWTVPPAFRMYQVENSGDSIRPGTTGSVGVVKYKSDLYDDAGSLLSSPEIIVENWTKGTIRSGEKGLAYYDTADCQYWFIPSASGSGSNIGIACSERAITECGGVIGSGGFDRIPNYSGWSDFIEWGAGLSISGMSFGGNSGILVSASGGASNGTMCVSAGGGCGSGVSPSGYDCISFSGFAVSEGASSCCSTGSGAGSGLTSLTIMGPTISGSNSACPPSGVGGTGEGNFFSHLNFGDGLSIVDDGECKWTVSSTTANGLTFTDPDGEEFGPNITGIGMKAISCGAGLTVESGVQDDCGGVVVMSTSGLTSNFDVVTDITCSGDSFAVTKISLNFCNGLLAATGEPSP